MSWFSGIKAYIYAGVAALVAGLLAVLKIKDMQLDSAREDRDNAQAEAKRGREYIDAEVEVEAEYRSRRGAALEEIKKSGTSKELDDPNDWEWVNDD